MSQKAFFESQLEAVFDNSADALFLVDQDTGKIIRCNKRAMELFEAKTDMDFIDRFSHSFHKEPVSPAEIAFVMDCLKKNGEWEGEVEYLSRTGNSFWGAVSIKLITIGRKIYQSIRITDITERVLVAERLKKSEAQLAEAQRMVSLGNWTLDLATRETNWSDEIYRQFGLEPGSPIPSSREYYEKYIHPDDREKVRAGVKKALEQGYHKFDHRIIRADGTMRHLDVIVKRVLKDSGEVSGIFGTMRDVTDLKIAEEIQRDSEEKIKASLREKELLLAEVHHRVKNNLAVISGLLGLQAGFVKDEQAKELFNESRNRIHSMALIHDKLYRNETLERIEFSNYISDLVSNIRDSYNPSNADIRFHLECSNGYIDIKNAVPCGLILNELVSNAYKHAFTGRESGEIRISFRQEDELYSLEVSDNGIGYHPGQKLTEVPTLGLTLVTSLVEQIEGGLEMRNTKGTTFTVTFRG
jgi:PAS domain S-box-containing protein